MSLVTRNGGWGKGRVTRLASRTHTYAVTKDNVIKDEKLPPFRPTHPDLEPKWTTTSFSYFLVSLLTLLPTLGARSTPLISTLIINTFSQLKVLYNLVDMQQTECRQATTTLLFS